MAHKPQDNAHRGTGCEGQRGILDLVPEQAGETQHGKGQQIVQNHGKHQRFQRNAFQGIHTQQQLKQSMDKAAKNAPAHAVAIADDADGQHAAQGNGTAVDPRAGELNQAQHGSHGDEQGGFGQFSGFVVHKHSPSLS